MIRVVWASIRERGFWRTLRIMLSTVADASFDWRYGTDTRRWAELGTLTIKGDNQAHGVRYVPTRTNAFLKVMDLVPFAEQSVFVDCGCGKGKVVLLAAQLPFQRVVGIEFAGQLCELARENVKQFSTHHPMRPVEICHCDVLDYAFRGDENVFFLFDPFDENILSALLLRIEAHALPPGGFLIYHNPRCRHVLDAAANWMLRNDITIDGSQFLIYGYLTEEKNVE